MLQAPIRQLSFKEETIDFPFQWPSEGYNLYYAGFKFAIGVLYFEATASREALNFFDQNGLLQLSYCKLYEKSKFPLWST